MGPIADILSWAVRRRCSPQRQQPKPQPFDVADAVGAAVVDVDAQGPDFEVAAVAADVIVVEERQPGPGLELEPGLRQQHVALLVVGLQQSTWQPRQRQGDEAWAGVQLS